MSALKAPIFSMIMLVVAAAMCVAQPAATPAAPLDKTKTPDGWVVIQTKGQKFQFGQQFTGTRWTFTYPVHEVSFTYNFMMDSGRLRRNNTKPSPARTQRSIPATCSGQLTM